MVRVQEEERLKIASDIHDVESAVQESIVRLRRLMFDLRPPALDRSGLSAALRDLLDRVQDETPIRATLRDTLPAEPSREVRTMAYRITQETVANIRKHSQAKNLQIEVGESDGGCLIKVIDDGIGFDVSDGEKPGHLGIAAMRGRARMAGGWWRAESPSAGGTVVTFWIPSRPGSETHDGGGAR